MTGRRHRSNCELVAQGAANIGAAAFGGFAATGMIARTATNVRAGARGPMSGIFHSLYLLLFVLIAAPLVSFIPLASLAAVLVIVAVNMADRREFWSLMRTSRGDALVLLATFFLTITYDLTTAIGVGVVLGSFLFLHRMEQAVEVEAGTSVKLVTDDQSDTVSARTRYDAKTATDRDLVVFRMSGAFFFGATARIGGLLDRIGEHPRAVILDFSDVPLIDTTATKMLRGFVQNMRRSGTIVYFTGTRRSVRRVLLTSGPKRTDARYMESIETAKQAATASLHSAASS